MSTDRILTLDEANALTGDDIAFWLSNPFMDPDALAQKVCWWMTAALVATPAADHPTPTPSHATDTQAKEDQ